MKKYEDQDVRIVSKTVCVEHSCDVCGRKAEFPDSGLFEWGGVGVSRAELFASYSIDADHEETKIDLCYECGSSIIRLIETGSIEPAISEERKRLFGR